MQKVSLAQADQSQAATAAIERKIIRNAEFTIDVAAPAETQRKVAAIAEAHGGFVVTSEAQQSDGQAQPAEVVNVVMRVPAAQFDAVAGEIRGLVDSHVRHEKTTGQDVTEEYIDLEARLRTQRALEAQYLEIMKQASKVSDALEVNRQLAEVRGVIEQTEGRRRFLENQAALSTIKVTLQTPAPLVSASTSGFFGGIKQALGDGVDIAAGIILVLIRLVIALVPVLLLIVLPLVLLWRFLRRYRRPRASAPPAVPPPAEAL
jgi:murein DD-endopeptidase MepM/ murein hydrolase activator NlpD